MLHAQQFPFQRSCNPLGWPTFRTKNKAETESCIAPGIIECENPSSHYRINSEEFEQSGRSENWLCCGCARRLSGSCSSLAENQVVREQGLQSWWEPCADSSRPVSQNDRQQDEGVALVLSDSAVSSQEIYTVLGDLSACEIPFWQWRHQWCCVGSCSKVRTVALDVPFVCSSICLSQQKTQCFYMDKACENCAMLTYEVSPWVATSSICSPW